MTDDERDQHSTAFLDALESVGVTRVPISFITQGDVLAPGLWYPKFTLSDVRRLLPRMIAYAEPRKLSVVATAPNGPGVKLIQLDDIHFEPAFMLSDVALMLIETSRASYQLWIAMNAEEEASGDYATRIRKGAGCDKRATGSVRIPGTSNFKPKHENVRGEYPVVKSLRMTNGNLATGESLAQTGLLADREILRPSPASLGDSASPEPILSNVGSATSWPAYEGALPGRQAYLEDFNFALKSLSWGRSEPEVMDKLDTVSARRERKIAERGMAYWRREVENTVRNAAKRVKPNPKFTPYRRARVPVFRSGSTKTQVDAPEGAVGQRRASRIEAGALP